ncbi:MAG: DUF1232 domain-containing protein [Acidobacteria bacterium]|nr:DUF1232 domain-containing protein [Acidobacteriota bacterium]
MSKPERTASTKISRKEKSEFKGRMRSFMMFLPNMVVLLGKLMKDGRVPLAEKGLFLAAIVYVISPIDLIPDVFPFIGQVDDIYLVALTLLRLINRTDESVVRENWPGGGDIVGLANLIAGLAPKLLPTRISRVLSSEVELGPAGKALGAITRKRASVMVEIPREEKVNVDSNSKMTN